MKEALPPLDVFIAKLEEQFVPRHKIILHINANYGARAAIEYAWGEPFEDEIWEEAESYKIKTEEK